MVILVTILYYTWTIIGTVVVIAAILNATYDAVMFLLGRKKKPLS